MKREEMFEVLNGIDEKYLNEADGFALRKRRRSAQIIRIVLPIAASLALMTILTLGALPFLTGDHLPAGTGDELHPPLSLLPLPNDPPPQYSENIVYQKYEDHAVIIQFQGNGQVAEVPKELGKLPVTKVELPQDQPLNYDVIHFNGSRLESLTLPSGHDLTLEIGKDVEVINPSALHNTSLSSVKVHKDNALYASFGGILYSSDFKTLIACPAGLHAEKLYFGEQNPVKGESNAPLGALAPQTTVIADEAFKNCTHLVDVDVRDGVLSIGRAAFEGCTALRSLSLPQSLQTVGKDALKGCEHLGYLHYPASNASFRKLSLVLPLGCQVYFPLPESDPALDSEALVALFEKAEGHIAWFSTFHMIPCDSAGAVDGYFPVALQGVSTMAELKALLEESFDKELVDSILAYDSQSEKPYFKELDGKLYVKPRDISMAYDDGERQYSFIKNADGTITVRVRVTVPDTVACICSDTTYLLCYTEEGYRFTERFPLPVECWYPLYLIESY